MRVTGPILTNDMPIDYEVIDSIYLDSCTPQSNMSHYVSCLQKLFKPVEGILLVNTCGWVDGLGKDILMQLLDDLNPDAVVSMKKKAPNQFHE